MTGCCIDSIIEQLNNPRFRPDVDNELDRRQQTGTSSKPIIGIESEESASDDDDADFTTIWRSLRRASSTPRAEPEGSDELEEPQRKKKRYSKNSPVICRRSHPVRQLLISRCGLRGQTSIGSLICRWKMLWIFICIGILRLACTAGMGHGRMRKRRSLWRGWKKHEDIRRLSMKNGDWSQRWCREESVTNATTFISSSLRRVNFRIHNTPGGRWKVASLESYEGRECKDEGEAAKATETEGSEVERNGVESVWTMGR